MWAPVLITVLILYLLISIFVYFMANSNILPSRRNLEYKIEYGAELRYIPSKMNPELKVAYWVAQQTDEPKNVILLHGFTRTSNKLQRHAEIYWELGYNLYFVDNLGHGYSSDLLYPSGYRYHVEVKHIIDTENIQKPIMHGLSMGAIAASVIAQLYPELPKAIVTEALPIDFKNLYGQLLMYLKIPPVLFPWIEPVSRKFNWKQFEEMGLSEEDYKPWTVQCPVYMIHSTSDRLFTYEDHFIPLREKMQDHPHIQYFSVEDSGHTRMINHPEYKERLHKFLATLN